MFKRFSQLNQWANVLVEILWSFICRGEAQKGTSNGVLAAKMRSFIFQQILDVFFIITRRLGNSWGIETNFLSSVKSCVLFACGVRLILLLFKVCFLREYANAETLRPD